VGKNIVVCCDGTANRYTDESTNTNVVKFYCLLERKFPDKQVAYYDPGVGVLSLSSSHIIYDYIDRATGYGIEDNIKQAYEYLMNTYEEGDRIFLFGFSRGAYTVRSLSGLLERCGLLEKRNYNLIDDAYYYYIKEGKEIETIAAKFKENFCRPVEICCIGVWDTVKAILGNPLRGTLFHDTKLSANVRCGYQALSIDEHRSQFEPILWEEKPEDKREILQVWFSGVHADVGGSYKEAELSDITLRWMIATVIKHGIHFKDEVYDKPPREPEFKEKKHDEYKNGFWFLLGSKRRAIPAGAKLHESVVQRMDAPSSYYRPDNLPKSYAVAQTPIIKDTRIKT
jgi:uncharacterized protein (DUF2235 family)